MMVEWLVLVFVLLMIFKLFLELNDKKINLNKFLFWTAIWFALVLIAFFPQIVFTLADIIGIGRPKDLPIYISIIILFYLIFKIGIKMERTEQEITKLVKIIALKGEK